MGVYAALDVSQELTAICLIDDGGALLAEGKVATCPDAIATWLGRWTGALEKVGMETGPLAVWLWNTLTAKGLPVVCLDARHASAALEYDNAAVSGFAAAAVSAASASFFE